MINLVELIGRILISALFLLNGIFKISNFEGTIGWMESFGISGMFLVPAIILEIAGPVLIIIGYKTKLAAGLLSLFCVTTAFIFHNDFTDQMQFTSFLKNIALAGGFLLLFVNGAKSLSLDNKFKKQNVKY
tara:strand:- start:818 stop:1210 length:393 start_codon:yes stop_codon:yes gene_type:complete